MEGYGPATYGDSFADVYDDWYSQVSDVDATVDLIAALTRDGGRALELGVGTGRIAIPLSTRGPGVVGVDSSTAMLERLGRSSRSAGAPVAGTLADMASLPFGRGTFDVVFAAYNTLFNLTDDGATRQCLGEVARVLAADGAFVVESFVAAFESGSHRGVEVRAIDIDRVVLTASMLDTSKQTITGQHIEIRESGIRMRPWFLRYLGLDQLDELATGSGLVLEERWAGWRREPFTSGADTHVSVYRRTEAAPPNRTGGARSSAVSHSSSDGAARH